MLKEIPVSLQPASQLLKRTTTRCPVCQRAVPGEVWREGARPARVVLRRTFPEHGAAASVLASDARFYWLAQGDRSAGGCWGGTCEATEAPL